MEVGVDGMEVEESATGPGVEETTGIRGAVVVLCSCQWSSEKNHQGEGEVTDV
jgi:hypothetical protein